MPQSLPELPETRTSRKSASTLVSRNITVNGRRTSVRLEPEMWHGIVDICRRERASVHEVCTAIACRKDGNTSLTAAIRVFIMKYFRHAATEDGHQKAGHGQGIIATATAAITQAAMAPVSLRLQSRPPTAMNFLISNRSVNGNMGSGAVGNGTMGKVG